ncbi:hypothetical protein EV363DRAFT_953534 [Boletus edulis]|nr:hypothetical protein EV363DRAFT_953534 [Boletus edulis]
MFKPFVKFLCAMALAKAILGQNIFIASPVVHTNVVAGSNITIQLGEINPFDMRDFGLLMGIQACTSASACPDVSHGLGQLLYSGPFTPAWHEGDKYNYQNFTVTVPSLPSGPVEFGVAHFFFVEASFNIASLEFTNITLNVVSSAEDGY